MEHQQLLKSHEASLTAKFEEKSGKYEAMISEIRATHLSELQNLKQEISKSKQKSEDLELDLSRKSTEIENFKSLMKSEHTQSVDQI